MKLYLGRPVARGFYARPRLAIDRYTWGKLVDVRWFWWTLQFETGRFG